jgi:putative Mg2+ transporter-C (MgtC) family protein
MNWEVIRSTAEVLTLATVLGAITGLEREVHRRPAGLRTHALVALGAALFTVAAQRAFSDSGASRIVAQVVSGIGFIGAGAVLRSGPTVKGLTSSAALWLSAAVGLAVGLREFTTATVAVILGVLVLAALRLSKRWLPQADTSIVVIHAASGSDVLDDLHGRLRSLGAHVGEIKVEHADGDSRVEVMVRGLDVADLAPVASAMQARSDVRSTHVRPGASEV